MKRYLFPLILVLLLTFTLIGDCWVSGYDQRIKLTTDHTKIDATLSNFPVTAFFTDAQAEEIFAEFDADEDFDRGQFALGDDTLLYADCELFDDGASLGIYHFKVTSISSSAGTDIYFYYDNDHANNTTYISMSGGTAAQSVYGTHKAVYHMHDDTTSTILDSTSNNNDGTKRAANEPVEATGKVGQGQDFDGADDYILITSTDFSDGDTVSLIANFNAFYETRYFVGGTGIGIRYNGTTFLVYTGGDISTVAWTKQDALVHFAAIRSGNNYVLYINGSSIGTSESGSATDIDITYLGKRSDGYQFDGIMDEAWINDNNSAAWVVAAYNSLFDSLLTYGSEETEAAEDDAVFFGTNV